MDRPLRHFVLFALAAASLAAALAGIFLPDQAGELLAQTQGSMQWPTGESKSSLYDFPAPPVPNSPNVRDVFPVDLPLPPLPPVPGPEQNQPEQIQDDITPIIAEPSEEEPAAVELFRLPAIEEETETQHEHLGPSLDALQPIDVPTANEAITASPSPHEEVPSPAASEPAVQPATPAENAERVMDAWSRAWGEEVTPPSAQHAPELLRQASPHEDVPSDSTSEFYPAERAIEQSVETAIEEPEQQVTAQVDRLPEVIEGWQEKHPAEAAKIQRERQAMLAVHQRADAQVRHAFSLAQRGAHYAARAELIEALRMITQALDARENTNKHSAALASAFRALEEADDFIPRGSSLEANLNLKLIFDGHRTPVLRGENVENASPLVALQRYYTFAQQQFTIAGGEQPAASLALYGLGRQQSVMNAGADARLSRSAPRAMVFHQAALSVDSANYKAANELGVLLARFGNYEQARSVLTHSVRVSPQPQSLANLALVHERLGELEMAQNAAAQAKLAARGGVASDADSPVTWVEPAVLANSTTPAEADLIPARQTANENVSPAPASAARNASREQEPSGRMRFIPWIRSRE